MTFNKLKLTYLSVLITISTSSCGLFFNSYNQSIVLKEFDEQQELSFKVPPELNVSGVYKIEICVRGEISGTIVLDENDNKELTGSIEQCYLEDWYQDSYVLTISPKTTGIEGELNFKTKFFY